MSNPQVNQGSLNRLLASVVFSDVPYLSVTSPFLGKEGISVGFEGDASMLLPTMTGGVPSPEPYQIANVTMHLLRTTVLGAAYKLQMETNTTLGSMNVISDTITLPPYQLDTCVLKSVQEITFDGNQPGMVVRIQGIYRINSAAFFSL